MALLPVAKRLAIVAAHQDGQAVSEIARSIGITRKSVKYWLERHQDGLDVRVNPRVGRPPALSEADLEGVLAVVAAHPQATLGELARLVEQEVGKRVVPSTLSKYLKRLGVERLAPERSVGASQEATDDEPARYSQVERRVRETLRYPSDLTDAEWKEIAPVFEPSGGRGRPATVPRREILNAIFYVLRTGCAWRSLPRDFPKWQNVYAHFLRWTKGGQIEEMHDRLRERWRKRMGRDAKPTAAIIDSQSVKTTEKGGLEDMTQARRLKDVSVILSSTPTAC